MQKTYLNQFIPVEFEYLTKDKKIRYKDTNLKTDYLINIIHELILKYYFSNELNHNLSSEILRKKYGKFYNIYIDYLLDKKFIFVNSNYFVGKKTKTFKLNITNLEIIKCKVNDSILLKKHSKEYLCKTFSSNINSPIDINIREKLINDLYSIKIDYNKAKKYLNDLKESKEIDLDKYYKNYSSISSIKSKFIFFRFDSYGRFHTNFTILKKWIRQNCLSIDGEEICELDISNSQPFFFALFLKRELGEENFNNDIRLYVDAVKNGLIYDILLDSFPELKNRNGAKLLTYKVLFGNNKNNKVENDIFRKLYPSVFEHIKDYKSMAESYKNLSHELQALESDCIFNNIVKLIYEKYPHIKLFTVHDSIMFPKKYKIEVELIFKHYINSMWNN